MKKFGLLFVLCVVMIAFIVACGEKGNTVRIGVIAELTGDMPAVGASCKNAAEMAVKEVNDAGGMRWGKEDTRSSSSSRTTPARRTSRPPPLRSSSPRRKCIAIIGPNASRYAIPASEIAESSKVVSSRPGRQTPRQPWTQRPSPQEICLPRLLHRSFSGTRRGKVRPGNLKVKKAAVLYDVASEYNKGIAEVFKETFEKNGGKVVAFETYTTNDKDFSAQLTKIKNGAAGRRLPPQLLQRSAAADPAGQQAGHQRPLYGQRFVGQRRNCIKLCGKDCEGYYFSTHYAADVATPGATKFIEGYKAKYGTLPDDVAALTYDSFGLLFQALKTAGKLDRQAVRNALAEIPDYEGVTGNMKFQEGSGDPIKSAVILQIKDGKFVWFANANP